MLKNIIDTNLRFTEPNKILPVWQNCRTKFKMIQKGASSINTLVVWASR